MQGEKKKQFTVICRQKEGENNSVRVSKRERKNKKGRMGHREESLRNKEKSEAFRAVGSATAHSSVLRPNWFNFFFSCS